MSTNNIPLLTTSICSKKFSIKKIIWYCFQEALQVVRKSKTVQQDKLRSFETSFLANMLQDFFHNLEKHKVKVYVRVQKQATLVLREASKFKKSAIF